MQNNRANVLSPIIVALIKDSALSLFLDKWQDKNNILTFKDVKTILEENNLDEFSSSPIIIKKAFQHFSLLEISDMIDESYKEFEKIVKSVLRAVGRSNDGPEIKKIEW